MIDPSAWGPPAGICECSPTSCEADERMGEPLTGARVCLIAVPALGIDSLAK